MPVAEGGMRGVKSDAGRRECCLRKKEEDDDDDDGKLEL